MDGCRFDSESAGAQTYGALFCRQVEETAWLGILDHPERAIRTDLNVADSVTYSPSLGSLRSTLAIKGDSDERLRYQSAGKG